MARMVSHIILGVLLWVVFGYYWYLVVQRPITEHTRFALMAVGLVTLSITVFLVGWIFHNIRISRRLHRRKTRPEGTKVPDQDFLGRTIMMLEAPEITTANYIEVVVGESAEGQDLPDEKTFRIKHMAAR